MYRAQLLSNAISIKTQKCLFPITANYLHQHMCNLWIALYKSGAPCMQGSEAITWRSAAVSQAFHKYKTSHCTAPTIPQRCSGVCTPANTEFSGWHTSIPRALPPVSVHSVYSSVKIRSMDNFIQWSLSTRECTQSMFSSLNKVDGVLILNHPWGLHSLPKDPEPTWTQLFPFGPPFHRPLAAFD